MEDPAALISFYEDAYGRGAAEAVRNGRWRALGAEAKAEHVITLCVRAGITPASVLEVGCGDGALLCELRRRAFGERLDGLEISRAAVEIARARPEIDSVELYDGLHLPVEEHAYELGALSHVLEHVLEPVALLRELARTCRALVIEVPLEANVSARRAGKRAHAAEVGHLQRFERADVRALAERAGLTVLCELEDALGLQVHRFFAASRRARGRASAKWAVRAATHRLAPPLARRLFTVHYACLCVPDG